MKKVVQKKSNFNQPIIRTSIRGGTRGRSSRYAVALFDFLIL